MDEQEAKVDEVWSGLDSESRERAIALFLEIARRFVINRQAKVGEARDSNNVVTNEPEDNNA
jgi:hypothetical protein